MTERADLDAIEARLAAVVGDDGVTWMGMPWNVSDPATRRFMLRVPTDLRTCVEELRLLRAVAAAAREIAQEGCLDIDSKGSEFCLSCYSRADMGGAIAHEPDCRYMALVRALTVLHGGDDAGE